MGFIRKILIFITGYAWLLLLLGPGMIAMSVYSGWKAEGDHAYAAREKLTTVTGKVVEASEVTVKRRRSSSTASTSPGNTPCSPPVTWPAACACPS